MTRTKTAMHSRTKAGTKAEPRSGKAKRRTGHSFVLVCPPALESRYRLAFSDSTTNVEIVRDLECLLASCVQNPPLAVLLDITLVRQVGSHLVAPLLDMRMNWPVIRCLLLPDGKLSGLCLEPRTHGPLLPMLEGIEAGDPSWKREARPARARRRHLRIEIQCRLRWRIEGDDQWHLGTTLDLGAGGAFVVTYEDLEKGTELEVEISDILPRPARFLAKVIGRRRWKDSPLLPGVGIEFDEQTVPATFVQALADSITLENLV